VRFAQNSPAHHLEFTLGRWKLSRARIDPTLIGFAVAGVVVMCLLAATYWLAMQQRRAAAWADESHEVLRVIANTRAALVDIQNGHRGFTIEGSDEALQPYREGVLALQTESTRLQSMLKDAPGQTAQLADLQRLIPQRLASAAQLVEARRTGGFAGAKQIVDSGWPAEQMHALRTVLQRMELQQEALFQDRLRAQQRTLQWFGAGVGSVALLLLLVMGMLYVQTRRRRANEQELLDSEERFRLMTESVLEYAIVMLDPDGRVRIWNAGAQRILGHTQETAGELHLSAFYTPEEVEDGKPAAHMVLARRAGLCRTEAWRMRRDGSRFWASAVLSAIHARDGSFRGLCMVLRDLTERRNAEEALRSEMQERACVAEQLQRLNRSLEDTVAERTRELRNSNAELETAGTQLEEVLRRLIHAQEHERRRIAYELHEEMGQALTAVRMDITESLRGVDAKKRMTEGLKVVDGLIAQIRGMVLRLRPTVLDDLGLADAIEWELNQHAKRSAWKVRLEVDADCPALGKEVETACFRIVQECLENTARHAYAVAVSVRLRPAGDRSLELSVTDDGIGFDVQRHRDPGERLKNFGLLSMAQRAHLVGGTFDIDAARGRGVCVRVTVPVQARSEPATAGWGVLPDQPSGIGRISITPADAA
jgi:PAS domain S-box-containing protein